MTHATVAAVLRRAADELNHQARSRHPHEYDNTGGAAMRRIHDAARHETGNAVIDLLERRLADRYGTEVIPAHDLRLFRGDRGRLITEMITLADSLTSHPAPEPHRATERELRFVRDRLGTVLARYGSGAHDPDITIHGGFLAIENILCDQAATIRRLSCALDVARKTPAMAYTT